MKMVEAKPITIYGTNWCGDCRRSKSFLDRNRVAYRWVDVERDAQAIEYIMKLNKGMRSVPTIVFPDGSILVEPSDAELGKKLGI
jgi:glutaredoxin-like protein